MASPRCIAVIDMSKTSSTRNRARIHWRTKREQWDARTPVRSSAILRRRSSTIVGELLSSGISEHELDEGLHLARRRAATSLSPHFYPLVAAVTFFAAQFEQETRG